MIEDSKPEIVFRLLVDSVGEINGEAEPTWKGRNKTVPMTLNCVYKVP